MMSFQVGISSLGGTVFSGGTLYPSQLNFLNNQLKLQKSSLLVKLFIKIESENLDNYIE